MLAQKSRHVTIFSIFIILILLIFLYHVHFSPSNVSKEPLNYSLDTFVQEAMPQIKSDSSVHVIVTSTTRPTTAPISSLFVHQSWKNKDLPPRFIRWFASWEICFPSYEHRLWSDDDNLKLVQQKAPDFLDNYIRYKDKIQRADAVRYLYMYHYGGVYSDLDNECLRTFQHLIDSSGCGIILGSMRSNREKQQYIQNSFMYSRPKHPFWLEVIEAMKERKDMKGVTHQDTVDLTTGPKLLMHSVKQHKGTYEGSQNPGPICVFPDTYFNPYSWDVDKTGPCKDLNKMTETDLANCKMSHKKAYVIQYHTQSWFAGKV